MSNSFPKPEYILKDQITRAATSICLNIAEGSNRQSNKDKAHFLNQALTSLEEVIAGFDLALEDEFITQQEMQSLLVLGEDIGKQLIGFSKSLQNNLN